jgi:hypothetical protein
LLGSHADLDIVFIHNNPPESAREIVRLTNEIHYDIEHHEQSLYQETRQLRLHPWLGPTLHDALILFDSRHFLDFIQAGVRGQFHNPECAFQRSQTLLNNARRYWLEHHLNPPLVGPPEIEKYLDALEETVNSLVLLEDQPLTIRRLGTEFAEHTQVLDRPELYGQFLSLLGGERVDLDSIKSWLPLWEESFSSLPKETCPAGLHPHRKNYYLKGMESVLAGDHPKGTLWPLLRTWTQAAGIVPGGHPALESWKEVCTQLQLNEEYFPSRLEQLDQFLEEAETIAGDWAEGHGVG